MLQSDESGDTCDSTLILVIFINIREFFKKRLKIVPAKSSKKDIAKNTSLKVLTILDSVGASRSVPYRVSPKSVISNWI